MDVAIAGQIQEAQQTDRHTDRQMEKWLSTGAGRVDEGCAAQTDRDERNNKERVATNRHDSTIQFPNRLLNQ